jgi:hypothetical protein
MAAGGWIPYLGGVVFSAGLVLLALALVVGACCVLYRLARYLARHFRGEWRTVLTVKCPPVRRLRAAGGLLLWAASAYAALACIPAEDVSPDVRRRYTSKLNCAEGNRVMIEDYTRDLRDTRNPLVGGLRYWLLWFENESTPLWGVAPAEASKAAIAGNPLTTLDIPGQNDFTTYSARRKVVVSVHGIGRDGQPVTEIQLGDGRDLGTLLIREGYARWDRQQAPHAEHLRNAEEEARAAHRGMWAAAGSTTAARWSSSSSRVQVTNAPGVPRQ